MLKRIGVFLCISVLLISLLGGCSTGNPIKTVSRTYFMFDTVVSITLYGIDDETVLDECRSYLEKYEDVFSATRETSELYKVNHAEYADGADTEISVDLYTAISRSLEWCGITEGRFDITIRPVSQLYNFGQEDFIPPSKADIDAGLSHVSYKNINVYENNGRFFLHRENPGIMLDLGAVSKGYISDRLKEFMIGKGVKSAVIDLGGNIMCIGGKIGENGPTGDFSIGVYNPLGSGDDKNNNSSDGSKSVILKINDKCVITSGVYQRSAVKDGVLYHHILDARTGLPAEGNVESVSVVCKEGIMGDILSTSLFLLAEDGIKAELPDDSGVMYLYRDGRIEYDGILKD